MPHNIVRLSNGLRLIHKEIDSPISHFGVLVNAGTRDETTTQMGLAHFVEHTIFKGTEKRNAYHVLNRMETVGGDLNASTSKEETYFHTSFLSQEYARAVELLSDIFFHSVFPEKELEKEKSVVLEEINYYQDSPAELIFDDFEDLVFRGHPLGKNILGTRDSVKHMTREGILGFIAQNYTLDHIVLASVGNISLKRLVRLCERYFGHNNIPAIERTRNPFDSYHPQYKIVTKKTSQANVMTGNLAYSIKEDKRTPFLLMTNIFGGQGMNSRLNMGIREKYGLAYTIEANYTSFSDVGLFAIYYGSDPQNKDHCLELIQKEMKKMREHKLGTMQLYYAKQQFVGQLNLSYETKLNEMLSIGHSALFFDEVDTVEESLAEICDTTAEDIMEVANEILVPEKFTTLAFTPR
ncbi:MAG: insulinase family protein [Bacteroidales bacterium]|nr:insulinase family protein [Bacteroidales bacterium]